MMLGAARFLLGVGEGGCFNCGADPTRVAAGDSGCLKAIPGAADEFIKCETATTVKIATITTTAPIILLFVIRLNLRTAAADHSDADRSRIVAFTSHWRPSGCFFR